MTTPAPFQAPTADVTIAGTECQFAADLSAFMALHELVAAHPDEFVSVIVDGEEVGSRMRMSPANAARYFDAFYTGLYGEVDWNSIITAAHPAEVIRAWTTINELLATAELDWQPEGEDATPFRPEPA